MILFAYRAKYLIVLCSIFLSLLINLQCYSKNLFLAPTITGENGIVETPVAGAFKDGSISFTSSKRGPVLHNTLSFQALPKVYAALRYTGIGDKKYMYYQNSGYTYWDRSFDLRFDLIEENNFIPSISAGFQDIVGGGIFGAEYIVASKEFNWLKLSTGLGWGRLSSNKIFNQNKLRKENKNNFGGGLK